MQVFSIVRFLLVRTVQGEKSTGKSTFLDAETEDLHTVEKKCRFSLLRESHSVRFLLVRMCLCVRGESKCRWKYILEGEVKREMQKNNCH